MRNESSRRPARAGRSSNRRPMRIWTSILLAFRRMGKRRRLAVLLMGLVGFSGAATGALLRGAPLPAIHDEFSYLLAADTYAQGRLTNPTHPHWHHFETFHVIHEPSYQSKYPPGQGLLLAFGQRLGGHPAVGLWIGAGALAAAMTWMLLLWLPSHWGMLVALLGTMQLAWVSSWSQSYWGGAVAAVGGALALGALRSIWRRPTPGGGLLLGVGLVVLALSRPFEGALLGLAMMGESARRLVRLPAPRRRSLLARGFGPAVAVVVLGLAWHGYYNLQVTQNLWTMPYQEDQRQYGAVPNLLLFPPGEPPAYRHAVMEEFWMDWGVRRHEWHRQTETLLRMVPWKLFSLGTFFLGAGVVALVVVRSAPRSFPVAAAAAGAALVVGASLLTRPSYAHYVAPATALFYVLFASGLAGLHRRSRKRRRFNLSPLVVAGVLVTSAVSISTFLVAGPSRFARERAELVARLTDPETEHLVLVRYNPGHDYLNEWVYNRADIDGSQVVFAREMGPELDRELIDYFDDRSVWLLTVDGDETDLERHPLAGERKQGRDESR
jgi:hypothetical protein